MHKSPWLKDLIAKLPDSMKPKPQNYGLVAALDSRGRILISLHDPSGTHLKEITSVNPHDGVLYFGSLHNDRIGRLPIPAIPALAGANP